MPKYETFGGQVTRGLTFSQINEKLIELQELAAVMAHLHNTEGNDMDKLLANGWLGVSEMFKRAQYQIIQLAKGSMQ